MLIQFNHNDVGQAYAGLDAASVEGFFPDKGTHTNAAGSMFSAKRVVSGLRSLPAAPLDPFLNAVGKAIAISVRNSD